MSNNKLLPCPFCGGETKIENRGQYGYGIVCISCGAKSPDFQTETNAIKSWNDYANDLLKMEQIEPEISLDGIHPDLINGLLGAKRNYPEIPDSSKELMDFVKFCRNASAKDIRQIHDRARDLIANYKEYCKKSCKDENATFEPLVPKWVPHFGGGESLDVSISQYKKIGFKLPISFFTYPLCKNEKDEQK